MLIKNIHTFTFLIFIIVCNLTSGNSQELNPIKKYGKYGFELDGKRVSDFQYDTIDEGWYNYFTVKKNGLWGVVSPKGLEVVPTIYEKVGILNKGLFSVFKDDFAGVYAENGEQILPIIYEKIDHIDSDLKALVKYQGRWCLIQNGVYSYDSTQFVYNSTFDIIPTFAGCEYLDPDFEKRRTCAQEKMYNYIFHHIKYPPIARKKGIQGQVIVSFTVSESGLIHSVELRRGIGGGCDEETIRVVEGMPRWNPAKLDGHPVSARFTLPVKFILK